MRRGPDQSEYIRIQEEEDDKLEREKTMKTGD